MTNADIDALEKKVNALCAEIDNALALKARHRVIVEHDDGNGDNGDNDYGDGDSNPSMDASEADDDEDNGNPGNDVEPDEDEEDDDLAKLGGPPRYQRESTAGHQQTNDAGNRPGALEHSTHRSAGLGNTPAVQPAGRHKFTSLSEKIQREENVSRTEAQSRARQRFPDAYRSYQDYLAGNPPQEQQFTRNAYRGSYLKRAPVTAEDYIAAEIRKGFSPEMAAQRVAQLHGFRAFDRVDAISKRANDIGAMFEGTAEHHWCDDASLSRTDALRKARLENRKLFRRYQRG
jgi:hypothetical protein